MNKARLTAGMTLVLTFGCADSGTGPSTAPGGPAPDASVAYLVRDINAGSFSSRPQDLRLLGREVVFVADDGLSGREPWVSDGSHAGTRLLRDLEADLEGYGPALLAGADGALFFGADDGEHGNELWRTDGTPEGTRLVKDVFPGRAGSHPYAAEDLGSLLLFRAQSVRFGGVNLWRTNGTGTGTERLSDLHVGGPQGVVGGQLFFFANVPQPAGERFPRWALWRTDGTPAGTRQVAVLPRDTRPGSSVGAADRLFFVASDLVHGQELWTSDGTEAGTRLLLDAQPGQTGAQIFPLVAAGARVFYGARSSSTANAVKSLWVSDGTAAGTRELVSPDAGGPTYPGEIVALGSRVFFSSGLGTRALWISDGTSAGTVRLAAAVDPTELAAHGGLVFFQGRDAEHGAELWRSDGTPQGTARVADILPGPEGSEPGSLVSAGERLFFAARTSGPGVELWAWGVPPPGQPSPASPAPPSGDNRAPSIDGLGSLPNNSTASVAFTPADPDGDVVTWTAALSRDDGKTGLGRLSCPTCDDVTGPPTQLTGRSRSGRRVLLSYDGVYPTSEHPEGSVIVTVTGHDGRGGQAPPVSVRIPIY